MFLISASCSMPFVTPEVTSITVKSSIVEGTSLVNVSK